MHTTDDDFIHAVDRLLCERDRHEPAIDPFPPGPRRIHVVSGSYGAGHDAAAREISRSLVARGHRVEQWDIVEMYPMRLGRLARWLYLKQLDLMPSTWGTLLGRLQPGTLLMRLACLFMALTVPALRRVANDGADLFVSTHPFASQALGRMRARGTLAVPAITYLVDASVHPLWVHASVDLHLGLHEGAVLDAQLLGGASRQISPLVPEAFLPHRHISFNDRLEVRRALGLSHDQRMVLVMGGSLGIGELEETAADVRDAAAAVPVVVCGTNEGLRQRLMSAPGVIALGWREDVPALIQSADCVVGNAGGFTAWESLAAGTPVITSRALPGHGTTNAEALHRAQLAPWVRSRTELAEAIEAAVRLREQRSLDVVS